jgi:phosphate starvation-inducible PhoH-like protein
VEAASLLEGIEGIEFIHFTDEDVVRHPLVQAIIRAYDRLEVDSPRARAVEAVRREALRGAENSRDE